MSQFITETPNNETEIISIVENIEFSEQYLTIIEAEMTKITSIN